MKKYFAVITISTLITSAFGFMEDRPSGHQLGGETVLWGSFLTNVDGIGDDLLTNIGFDYSISDNVELSFDLLKDAGEKIKEADKEIKLTIWAGESLGLSVGCEPGRNSDDSNFYNIKYVNDGTWVSFKTYDESDSDTWAVGKVWTKNSGCTMGISYHFDSDDFDKGWLQLSLGKVL